MNFVKYFRNPFLHNTSGRLLLRVETDEPLLFIIIDLTADVNPNKLTLEAQFTSSRYLNLQTHSPIPVKLQNVSMKLKTM